MYKLDMQPSDFDGIYNGFLKNICQHESFASENEFRNFCDDVLRLWPEGKEYRVEKFHRYLEAIREGRENTISTPWGGVFITKHEHPLVEKYLVVQGGHSLSFEKHAEKEEHLEVIEGEGVLLQRDGKVIRVKRLYPGVEANFAPGEEHCIIAPQDLLIFENSFDFKGMDKDLIFIYNPR